MMKNSNEIRPPHTPASEGGFLDRDPHTLYNNFLTNALISELLYIPWHLGYADVIDYAVKRIEELEKNV